MSFDKKEDISKLGTVELSDDALEGVSGGASMIINGIEYEWERVSPSPSTPKPSTQGRTPKVELKLDSSLPGINYVKHYYCCNTFKAKSSASGYNDCCKICEFFDSVDTSGGYCRHPAANWY